MKISVRTNQKQLILTAESGERLLDVLIRGGCFLPANCGGNGTCGKCKVRVLSGTFGGTPVEDGRVLSCRARVIGDASVELSENAGSGLSDFSQTLGVSNEEGFGVAVDVGTTTVAAYLVNFRTGIVDRNSCLNPQIVLGADVISRIQACMQGKTATLQTLILEKVRLLVDGFRKKHGVSIKRIAVSGNTTMLHLFLGVDASPLGGHPFRPVFLEARTLAGDELGLAADEVIVLPSVSAFVGSDITAGLAATDFSAGGETKLFLDIGTNGEMALAHGGKMLATSTAAGPALEGANIECGMGGVAGAVDRVTVEDGELVLRTIGNLPPAGICGSGLADLVAVLLDAGVIDETGAFAETDETGGLFGGLSEDRFMLTDEIWLSQKDVRQFQLAKSAICSGLLSMLDAAKIDFDQVSVLYLAGGLGYYMRQESAIRTGILPAALAGRIRAVGNSSLFGAAMCLTDPGGIESMSKLAGECEVIDLTSSEFFSDAFIDNMMF